MSSTLDPRAGALETAGQPVIAGPQTGARPERAPEVDVLAPVIRRETLTWSGGRGERPLVVEFDAENPHDRPTPALLGRLAIAPFGAFLPHRTVDAFGVPTLMPRARTHFARPVAPFLVPPPGDPLFREMLALQSDRDPWIGSFQVWVGQHATVERNVASLLCPPAGRRHAAQAYVTCEPDDAVSYARSEADDGWKLELFHHEKALLRGYATEPVRAGQWFRASPMARLELEIRPPAGAAAGGVFVVTVTRRSDGVSVPLEFRLRTASP